MERAEGERNKYIQEIDPAMATTYPIFITVAARQISLFFWSKQQHAKNTFFVQQHAPDKTLHSPTKLIFLNTEKGSTQ